MSVRLPSQVFVSNTQTDAGASSVAGGVAIPFLLPQDTDNVVVKMVASTVGGGVSALFQTSDDGGTTWYDVARTSIVSSNEVGKNPQFLSIPTIQGPTNRITASLVATGSVIGVNATGTIGAISASTLGAGQFSGLPIMGTANRVFLIYTGTVSVASIVTTVRATQQSATA